jgi:hypothetical protein
MRLRTPHVLNKKICEKELCFPERYIDFGAGFLVDRLLRVRLDVFLRLRKSVKVEGVNMYKLKGDREK